MLLRSAGGRSGPVYAGLAAAALALAAAPAWGAARPAPYQDLDRVLAKADALAEKGKWAAARETLKNAIASPASRETALLRFGEIRRRLGGWAFREKNPDLQPAQILSGEVTRWKERRLELGVRYDWAGLEKEQRQREFFAVKDDWFFAVPFEGDLKMVLHGRWPRELIPISFLVGYDREDESGWRITPGFKLSTGTPAVIMPRRLERFGRPPEVLLRQVEDLEEAEGDWSFSLDVKRNEFFLRSGNERLGSWKTEYRELLPGHAGFSGREILSVELDGRLNEEEWSAFLEREIARRQEIFRAKEYDPVADWPEWMQELAKASDVAAGFPPPADAPEEVKEGWKEVTGEREESFDAEVWAQQTGAEGPILAYARALDSAREGAWLACKRAADEAWQGGLETGGVLALRGRAQFMTGERQKALDALRAKREAWPVAVGWEYARLNGRFWGPRELLKACDEAIASGNLSQRILGLRTRLESVLAGPRGEQSARFSGTSFVLLSEGRSETTRAVGESASAFIQQMILQAAGLPAPREPMLVLHFNEKENREFFCRRTGLPDDTVGYVPELRLSLWQSELIDPDTTDAALQGMLWDEFVDSSLDVEAAPPWFVAGNRRYFEATEAKDYKLLVHTHREMVDRLAGNAAERPSKLYILPHELIQLSPASWRQSSYTDLSPKEHQDNLEAESWLLVHLLRTTRDERLQGSLGKYVAALRKGADRRQAYQEAFGGLSPEELDRLLGEHRQAQVSHRRR